jgi:peptidoglycan/xylan/chitin deacetylase (PgdA/CDA1 family)
MKMCQEEIYGITGIRPNIIRFPGGSYKRLNKSFLNTLHDNSFKVYDWNAYMSDGINPNTPVSKLYREATETTVSEDPILLLMHCDYMHKNTCKALPMVIKYYKEKGYEFRIITEDTPEITFPLS